MNKCANENKSFHREEENQLNFYQTEQNLHVY